MDDDQETAKMKELIKFIPNEEEVVVDAIPLAIKPPSIVDWKIVKEGKFSYYQIIRANRNKAVYKELGDSLVRATTTASSLEAECQETMGDTIAQTRFESVSKQSNDALLARGNTLQSDEDRLKIDELMALCTTLQNRVLDLEKTKTTQQNEIVSLKRKVKKLEKKSSLGDDASKQGRIDAIDADEEITLVSVQNVDEEIFDVNVLDDKEVFVAEQEVAAKEKDDEVNVVEEVVEVINTAKTFSNATTTNATITTIDDITLAQALMEIKSIKPKEKRVVIQDLGESTTKISSQLSLQQSQDKAEFHKKERLAREKAKKEKEANIALIETWDDIQAKIDVDHQLAERLQAQEQEELSIEEKATLFQKLLEKRRKHFTAKKAKEKRNKPPTKA
ncbi:hypothetical protein Tco_0972905 [Tanacetum coccineum]